MEYAAAQTALTVCAAAFLINGGAILCLGEVKGMNIGMDIGKLYQRVFEICFRFAVFFKKNVRKETEKLLPLLEEFSREFLKGNEFGISDEEYQFLQGIWIEISEDIMEGLEQNDRVLLEDAMEYGLMQFLEMFFEEEELSKLKEGCCLEP